MIPFAVVPVPRAPASIPSRRLLLALSGLVATAGYLLVGAPLPLAIEVDPVQISAPAPGFGRVPLLFEENRGQSDAEVRFLARTPGYTLFVTPQETVWHLRGDGQDAVLRMRIAGTNAAPQVRGESPQGSRSNYFTGRDPARWISGVPQFGAVRLAAIYPGIDLKLYGNPQQLEYDFIVQPGADPGTIRLRFDGAQDISLDDDGALVLQTAAGRLVQHRPMVYQDIGNERIAVAGQFRIDRGPITEVAFELGDYDPAHTLVIDPVYEFSTYLGGTGSEFVNSFFGTSGLPKIALDGAGNVYVAGLTGSADFPVTPGAYQATLNAPSSSNAQDIFVAKFNPAGDTLLYATYLGGGDFEQAIGIDVDAAGNAYVAGNTQSADFPTTAGAFQTVPASNPFIAKLDPTGSALVYSTYLGSPSGGSNAGGFALDSAGSVYLLGSVPLFSSFPTTPGAYSETCNSNWFLAKLKPDGSGLAYATCFDGGNVSLAGLAVDGDGEAYVATLVSGQSVIPATPGAFDESYNGSYDGFILKFNAAGSALEYATYLGGAGNDQPGAIAVDAAGNAYVSGGTYVTGSGSVNDFPVTAGVLRTAPLGPGGVDGFIAKLNASGSALIYASYLGVHGPVAVDSAGKAYVAGFGGGEPNVDAPPESCLPYFTSGRVVKINAEATAVEYSFLVGGPPQSPNSPSEAVNQVTGLVPDDSGNLYFVGITNSFEFPTNHGFQKAQPGGDGDDFFAKISPQPSLPMPTLQFSAANYSVNERAVSATIIVTRNGPAAGLLRVAVKTSDGTATAGTDYTTVDTMLEWRDGDETSRTLTIPILADGVTDPGETVNLTLSKNWCLGDAGTPASAVLTINEGTAPAPGTVQFSAASYSAGEGDGHAVITLTRSGGSAGVASVQFATTDGSARTPADYTALIATVHWADGDAAPKTVNLAIADDALVEGDETVALSLANAIGTTLGTPATAALGIADDDVPPVPQPGTLQFSAASYRADENGGSATITVTRSGGSDGVVGITYATSDGSARAGADYTRISGNLAWSDGDDAAKTYTIAILDDAADEPDETVNLSLSAPNGGATLGNLVAAVLTITDNDEASPPSQTEVQGGAHAGGGAFDARLLSILLGLLIVRRLRSKAATRRSRQALACAAIRLTHPKAVVLLGLCAALTLTPAQADNGSPPLPGTYVGLRGGIGHYQLGKSELAQSLSERGHQVTVAIDDSEPAFVLYAGLPVFDHFALEFGYAELGKYAVGIAGSSAAPEHLAKDVAELLEPAGRAVTVGMGGALPITRWLSVSPHLALMYYRSTQHAHLAGATVDIGDDGLGFNAGLGLLVRLGGGWHIGVAVDEFWLNSGRNVELLSGQIEYRLE